MLHQTMLVHQRIHLALLIFFLGIYYIIIYDYVNHYVHLSVGWRYIIYISIIIPIEQGCHVFIHHAHA